MIGQDGPVTTSADARPSAWRTIGRTANASRAVILTCIDAQPTHPQGATT